MIRTATISVAAAAALLASCASAPTPSELDAQAQALMRASFRDEGIAKADRIHQDLAQQACSSESAPAEAVEQRLMAEARASVKPPSGGRYIGDWREGEKIAQSGRGMTWTDTSTETSANGGNCYNCHQISKQEISYGTIGPSLLQFGKLRGVTDLASPAARAMIDYTWAKLWNARAFNACSSMPRFGHMKLLDETQIAHLMALLLDPKSPVNQ